MSSEQEPGQPQLVKTRSRQWRGVLREYADRLNVTDATPIITLGEEIGRAHV